ncbi:MAG: hypothetical protein HGB36_05740 [Chlorobiaceae bacterium]|nr:hypothetical protein [Chlorobiaceae bacterium]
MNTRATLHVNDEYNHFHLKTERIRTTVILAVIQNAIKFTHEGHIEFGYEINGEMLEFYVLDTGTGIPE